MTTTLRPPAKSMSGIAGFAEHDRGVDFVELAWKEDYPDNILIWADEELRDDLETIEDYVREYGALVFLTMYDLKKDDLSQAFNVEEWWATS